MTPSLSGKTLIRSGAIAAVALSAAGYLAASDLPTSPELQGNSSKENWISLSGGTFMKLDGNEASFQKRHQHEGAGFGGADSFQYNTNVFGDRTLRLDGKAVIGDGDYRLHARLNDENNGWYLDAGLRENTIFYVGNGGYSPGGLWVQPFDDQLDIRRGELWLEAGLKKDAWNLTIRTSHQYRKGSKDSTIWGDSAYSGLGTAVRKTSPTLMEIDETRDTLAIDLGYENEALEAGAGVRWESIETDNSNSFVRSIGQFNRNGNGERWVTTDSGTDSDLFAAHAYVVKNVSGGLTLSGAASKTTLDTVLSADRIYGGQRHAAYSRTYPHGQRDEGYIDLGGNTQWDQWVLVGNATYLPTKNWTINAGLRYENQTQDSFSEFIETAGPQPASGGNPARPYLEEALEGDATREFDEVLATLEANYDGINNWVITPFVEFATGSGNLQENELEGEPPTQDTALDRNTDYDRDYLRYGVNARWYPANWFNGAVGVYRKSRDNSYNTLSRTPVPSPADRYPAFIEEQDFTVDDLYLRGTIRATQAVSLTARWDRQRSTIETSELGLVGTVSSDQDIDILSGTLNWTATSNVSAQIGVNFVYDQVVTGDVDANAVVASRVGKFSSDYRTYNAVVMVALNEDADLQFDFYQYTSDNYRTVYVATLPYGMEADEQVYGVTYTRRLSADMILSLRAVVSDYNEPSSGGHMDYKSEMVYGRLQMRF